MAIDKTKLTGVEKVYPLNVSPYEQYMGDFQNPSVVSKVNAMIQSLHQIGRLTNETVSQWNSVMRWIVEGGMDDIAESITNEKVSVALEEVMRMLDVSLDNGLKELAENVSDKKIDELLASGQFESMISESLVEINEVVEGKLEGFNLQLEETDDRLITQYAKKNVTRTPVLSLNSSKIRKPLVSFVDDDGADAVMTKLKPLSEQHGIPFVIALIGSYIESGIGVNVEQALQLQNELGWEIASHEYNHVPLDNVEFTIEDYEYELTYACEYLRSKGFNIQNLVYPYGRANEKIREITSKSYNSAVSTNFGLNEAPIQNYDIRRIAFPQEAPNNTLEWYKSKVDEAISKNAWLVWMLHCGTAEHDTSQQQILNDLIVYIKSKTVDIVTLQEALDRVGNVFSVAGNKFWMGSDGKNNMVNYMNFPINTTTASEQLSADMTPKQFEMNKTYTSQIYTALERAKFPPNTNGIFTTVMTDSYLNSYQTFHSALKSYKRIGKTDGTGWGEWLRQLEGLEGVFATTSANIPAKTSVSKTITTTYYDYSYMPVITPKFAIPTGVIFSIRHNGNYGQWIITMFNSGDVSVDVPDGNWAYMLIRLN